MFNVIRRLLSPPVFKGDDDKTYTASLLNIILLSILLGVVLYGLASPFVATAVVLRLLYVGSFTLVVVGLLVLTHRGHVRFVSVATVVSIWAILTPAAITSGGVRAPAFSGYIIAVISAGLLLGRRAALASALVCTLMGVLLLYAGSQGALPVPELEHDDVSLWLSQAVYFFVAAVLVTLALRRITRALERARREIAERLQAETALRASEGLFRALFEHSPDAIFLIDQATFNIVDCNEVACNMNGYRRDELVGQSAAKMNAGEVAEDLRTTFARHLTNHVSFTYEIDHRRKDGSVFPVEVVANSINVAGRELILGIDRDITERKRAEEDLRESEARFRGLSEAAFEGIMIHEQGTILDANQEFADLFEYQRPEDLIGRPGLDVLSFTPESRQLIQASLRSGSTGPFEITVARRDGSVFPAETQGRAMLYQGREVRVVAMRDITERKRAQEALQRSAARLEILHEIDQAILAAHSIEAVVQAALSRIHLLVSNRRTGVILFSPETGEALSIAEIVDGQLKNIGTRFPLSRFEINDALRHGHTHVQNDLSSLTSLSAAEQRIQARGAQAYLDAPLMFHGELMGALTVEAAEAGVFQEEVAEIVRDVADQLAIAIENARLLKQTQHYAEELEQRVAERTRELAQANERLTELDRLKSKFVSDVSHELRTPITNLKLYLELLARGQPEKRESYLATLKQQTYRLAQLVEDILSLSRLELGRDRVAFAPVDLNAVVAEIVAVHQPQAEAAGVLLCFEPDPYLPPVRGEENQLAQVVTNLVANALNYTKAGHVNVSIRQIDQRVCLCVADTGIGIDSFDLVHLFDRFYRGKRALEMNIPGTGLGLNIVKEIVNLHDGQIEVESEVGKGTTFRVWLPISG